MKDRIKHLMEVQHMNQQTFANATGIGTASLSSIFTGRTRPTLNHVDAILDKFPNVNPLWLLKGQGGMFLMAGDNTSTSISPSETPNTEAPDDTDNIQIGGLFDSANMSVEPSMKNGANGTLSAPAASYNNARNQQQSFLQFASHRKITEIRLFYDDQTWETFIPKNK